VPGRRGSLCPALPRLLQYVPVCSTIAHSKGLSTSAFLEGSQTPERQAVLEGHAPAGETAYQL
jgi:hypothetical protein